MSNQREKKVGAAVITKMQINSNPPQFFFITQCSVCQQRIPDPQAIFCPVCGSMLASVVDPWKTLDANKEGDES